MAVKVKVSYSGNEAKAIIRAASKAAIADAAEYILQESNKIVPLDEGTLQRSGNTSIEQGAKGFEASIYYDTPYAIKLHEHPEFNFQNGREGKYLEKTVKNEATRVAEYLKNRINSELE